MGDGRSTDEGDLPDLYIWDPNKFQVLFCFACLPLVSYSHLNCRATPPHW